MENGLSEMVSLWPVDTEQRADSYAATGVQRVSPLDPKDDVHPLQVTPVAVV